MDGFDVPLPGTHLLTNGRYKALLTADGGGYATLGDVTLTRRAPDPAREAEGVFVYLRDHASGVYWSASHQPVPCRSERSDARFTPGMVEFVREHDGIETRLEVAVCPSRDLEVRLLTLTNRTDRARRIEVTTYAEPVLADAEAHAAHPAFSKLFLETSLLPDGRGLFAVRRPRRQGDATPCLAHALVCEPGAAEALALETERARFVGRGRSLSEPLALTSRSPLSGTVGRVLDPVLSLRRIVALDPGGTARLAATFAAGSSREAVTELMASCPSPEAAAQVVHDASRRVEEGAARSGRGEPEQPLALHAQLAAVELSSTDAGRPRTDFTVAPAPEPSAIATGGGGAPATGEPLRLFNGYGGFSPDGTEYVIRLRRGPDGLIRPPQPWVNVIANENFGFLVSESGAGMTWSVNSQQNRLTPWFNDPVRDPHGEAVYLRDDETGVFWSPTPGPTPGTGDYEVRHGFGYSRFRHNSSRLEQDLVVFAARSDPVKLGALRIANRSDRRRRLTLFWYAEWVLGEQRHRTARFVVTEIDRDTGAVLATNPAGGEHAHRVAIAALIPPPGAGPIQATADRAAAPGTNGSVARPAAVAAGAALDSGAESEPDPCAACSASFEIAPGETLECAVLLGQADDRAAALELLRRYRQPGAARAELDAVRDFWRSTLSGVQVETPWPEIDLMVNGWLGYQNLSCRLWGRSALYQSGGAYGFRDQLQDAAAMLYLAPELTRRQILLHAAHQFAEGDVLHWWHPPASRGFRSRCSDDLLWLPYVTAFYVRSTGDNSVLDDAAPFLCGRALADGEDEALLTPEADGTSASVYEHCFRALDRALTRGRHGLPLIGTGDWNDGMNRVGREGQGESVWLGFFQHAVLEEFIPLCDLRGDAGRAARYRAHQRRLASALNDAGWDGAWYRRAFYDDGTPLGSAAGDECRIDAIAQAWAVLSGVAPRDRAAQALAALEQHLVDGRAGIIRLLAPPFDRTPKDPGYIRGYLPGIRENGGQYTHGALWVVRAFAEFGRAERAASLLAMLSPVRHARTPAEVAVYQVEPYVIAADVYAEPPHVGRGGWTWYTGSAGWMFRVALESILGVSLSGGTELLMRPCLPPEWPGYTLLYRLPDGRTKYTVSVRRAHEAAPTVVVGDGVRVEDGAVVVPLVRDGGGHRVEVTLGDDLAPRYRERARRG